MNLFVETVVKFGQERFRLLQSTCSVKVDEFACWKLFMTVVRNSCISHTLFFQER